MRKEFFPAADGTEQNRTEQDAFNNPTLGKFASSQRKEQED